MHSSIANKTNQYAHLQARREGGVSYPGPRDFWGPRRRSEIKRYTRVHHCEKNFSPEGPAKMFPRAPLWLSTGLHTSDGGITVGPLRHAWEYVMHHSMCHIISGVISVNRWGVPVYVTYCFCSSNTGLKVRFTGEIN